MARVTCISPTHTIFNKYVLSAYLLSSIAFCAQDISVGNKITDLIGITVENQCPVKNVESMLNVEMLKIMLKNVELREIWVLTFGESLNSRLNSTKWYLTVFKVLQFDLKQELFIEF